VENKHFIKAAIKRPGALTRRAESHGKSVAGQAAADEHKPGLAGDQARFYENVLKPANEHRRHGDGSGHWSGH
jgi:hypothetical protein